MVVSTVGSQLTIVTAREQTGTNRDRNYAEARPVSDPILDATALTAAKAAIEKARPGASVATLRLSDAKLLADQEKWFGQEKLDAPELMELLKAEIGDDPATRLIIIAAHRADILLRLEHGYVGFGKAAGLGFYIDRVARVSRSDTGQKGQGVFGPFANFRIVLVDPRSLVIEREQAIAAGTARSATRPKIETHGTSCRVKKRYACCRSCLPRRSWERRRSSSVSKTDSGALLRRTQTIATASLRQTRSL